MKDHPALTPRGAIDELRQQVDAKFEARGVPMDDYSEGVQDGVMLGILACKEAVDKIPESSTPPLLLEEFEKWLWRVDNVMDMDKVTCGELIDKFRKDPTKS